MEQQTTNPTQQNLLSEKRPRLITVFCVIGFIVGAADVVGLFIPGVLESLLKTYESSLIPISFTLLLFEFLFDLIGLVGYWKMRKWGVYVYTAATVFSIGLGLISGGPISYDIFYYIFALILTGIGFANLKKMS